MSTTAFTRLEREYNEKLAELEQARYEGTQAYLDAKEMERNSILAPGEYDFAGLTTLCWRCNKQYPCTDKTCPKCHAINANIDPHGALKQLNEKGTP